MDIEQLRTFLEVVRTRHFGKAADELSVTQSAVSARIRQLEQTLGKPLFTRHRNNIQLTAEGQQLRKHAETIVQVWTRARQETGLGTEYGNGLAIGAVADLWYTLLDGWLPALRDRMQDTALHIESGSTEMLIRKLQDSVIDLAVLFEPSRVAELEIRELGTFGLVLAATQPGYTTRQALASGYIMVDWGTAFAVNHARLFPDIPAAALHINQGTLARSYLQQVDGAAYLPEQMLEGAPGERPLYRVEDAPRIERPVFSVYSTGSDRTGLIRQALALLP
jgi:DNA-binding transcriptional LysR family regulator